MTRYVGTELPLFALADNWKRYLAAVLRPHLGARVLEVGAGLGSTTAALCGPTQRQWVCLEPDPTMAARLTELVARGTLPGCCRARRGVVRDIGAGEVFDTVLYVDVLEHIDADGDELEAAASYLAPRGRLVVVAPAYQWLYTAFDEAIGHYRRYDRASMAAAAPRRLRCIDLRYLDSVGLLASLGNRWLLRSPAPTERHIVFWDRLMVPMSRRLDGWLGFRAGKTIVGVWEAPEMVPKR